MAEGHGADGASRSGNLPSESIKETLGSGLGTVCWVFFATQLCSGQIFGG